MIYCYRMSSGQGNAFSEGGFYYTIRSEVLFPMLQTILNVVLILLIIGVVVMAVLPLRPSLCWSLIKRKSR